MPTRKRKLSEDENDHSPSRSPPRILPLPKRRRFDLSRNLSRLSLFEGIQPVIEEPSILPSTSLTSSLSAESEVDTEDPAMEVESEEPLHRPTSIQPVIEEPRVDLPTNPPITPEVRMRHSSSYEPEKDRIIITDLDSSEDESEEPVTQSAVSASENNESYTVSSAYLARISKAGPTLPKSIIPDDGMSRALVVFKPLAWSAKDTHELHEMYQARDTDDSTPHPPSATSEVSIQSIDPDAMDVE
ncbi:hypothetical protein BU17DRAFT_95655 [Hysterangium stoloniferum]|nr:hypothetical protein BU17DRAFT_95655 [Hysterangium stoloniferum]